MRRVAGREKAIDLAIGGMSARDICGYFDDKIAISTISQWLTDARRRGANIPRQKTAPVRRSAPAPYHNALRAKPKPIDLKVEPLTPEDESRLAELARREVGLTAIAAHMRKPYSMIADAMQRLGLSRAGDVTISTRAM